MQKFSTKSNNSNEWVMSQKAPKKVPEPVPFEEIEKGGKTTASRVSIYLCCYDQILWMLKFRYKNMPKILTEPINSNERVIDQPISSWNLSQLTSNSQTCLNLEH